MEEKKPYEGKKYTSQISKNDVIFKKQKIQKFTFDKKVELSMET